MAAAQANLSTAQTEQVAAFQRGQQLRTFIAGQDPDAQRKIFDAMSHDDQVLLTQAGYEPPKPKKRSIWGSILHEAGHIGNDVLQAAGAPLRAVQHVYRADLLGMLTPQGVAEGVAGLGTRETTSVDANGNLVQNGGPSLFNPSSWVAAWRNTSHGQRTFDAKALDDIKGKYNPDVFNLALRQASGDSVMDITGGNPDTIQQLQKVAKDPTYKQALADIQAAHISPGRDLANGLGIKPGSEAFKLTSGTTDGLADWFMDPTLVGGKLAKAGIALKWGIRAYDSTRIEKLMQTQQAQRGWSYIIPRLNTIKNSEDGIEKGQAIQDINRHFPNVLGLVDPLIDDAKVAGTDVTMDSVTEYLSGADGYARMVSGLAAREVPTLPGRLSKFGEARIAASDGFHKAIDFATDGRKFLPYDYLTPEEIGAKAAAEANSGAQQAYQEALDHYNQVAEEADRISSGVRSLAIKALPDAGPITRAKYEQELLTNARTMEREAKARLQDAYAMLPESAASIAEGTRAASQAYGEAALQYRKSLGGRMRYIARRLTTRIPNTGVLDVSSRDALKHIRQTALTYLPTQRANEITASFAAADLAGKRAIYKGLLQELGHASGITMSRSGSDWWARFMGDVDASAARENYSALPLDSGVGVRQTTSGKRALGLTAGQMTEKWALPSFKEMQQNAARIGVADRAAGLLNNSWVDGMMGYWRTSVLFRVAFPLRVALEDVFNAFYRGNGMDVLKARVATSLLKRSAAWEPPNVLARGIGKVADGVTAALGAPTSGSEIATHYLLSKIGHVINAGMDKILDPDYKRYIQDLLDGKAHDRLYNGIIEENRLAAEGAGEVMPDDLTADTKWGKIGWRPNGTFDVSTAQGMNGALRWSHNLAYADGDIVAQHVLLHPELSFEEIEPQLMELMKSPEYRSVIDSAEIANWTKDGRSVAAGEATQDEALHDWAQDIYTNFQHLVRDGDGKLIKPLVTYLKKSDGVAPPAQWLNQRELGPDGLFTSKPLLTKRPDTVNGPEFVPYTKATAANLIQKGWDNMIARPMNWLSRQPISHYEYVRARKMLQPWQDELIAKGVAPEYAKNMVVERAETMAHERAIKFIHNPALRSQFSVLARNLFPFRHAEESALQRWSTAMVFSPEGIRRAQLTYEGLRHSGIITQDTNGNPYLVFPGSGALIDLSAKLANLLPGVHIAELPIRANLHMPIQFISPFLSQFGGIGTGNNAVEKILSVAHPLIPPSGPVLGTALSLVNQVFPESRVAQDARSAFVSKEGQGKPIWEQFVPTAVSRIYGAFQGSNDANSQLASAMRNAAAYMEAAGLTPKPDATPKEVDQYLNRLKSWSRNLLVMRAIFGFATPSAPTVDSFAPEADELFAADGIHSITDEFYELTSEMPYEDALQTFIKMHPDDSPFVVPQSESASGAYMPATTKTLDWIDSHADIIKRYPSVAPFLMPLDSGEFNYDAYKEQLATGLRKKKSVKDFYKDLKIRTASDTYYKNRNAVQQAEAQLRAQGRTKEAEAVQAGFSAWSQQFQSLNPFFAEYLSQGSERQQHKLEAIQQLQKMVESGDLEKMVGSEQTADVEKILGAWQTYLDTKQSLYGRSDKQSTAERHAVQTGVDAYINDIASQNSQLQGLYSTIFAPLLESN